MDLSFLLAPFYAFTLSGLFDTLTSPDDMAVCFALVLSEGLLSADNAIVLAMMVKHLPEKQRHKALYYGIVGAYSFRFLAIAISVYLVQIQWIKIIGGAYLLYLAISHFRSSLDDVCRMGIAIVTIYVTPLLDIGSGIPSWWTKIPGILLLGWLIYSVYFRTQKEESEDEKIKVHDEYGFWKTVAAVECMDVAFSTDSILAAIGMSNNVWVRLIGELAGIAMMRVAAGFFLKLIEKIPALEHTAYILILIVGAKMTLSGLGWFEMESWIFIGTMVVLFAGTIGWHYSPVKPEWACKIGNRIVGDH